jgi:ribonuclease P/MRP protein subunit POP5
MAVALETWPAGDIARESFQRTLWYNAQNLSGDTGSAVLDLSVLAFQFDGGAGQAIVRVRRGSVDEARSILACMDTVEGDSVGLRVLGTSGTIQACEEKYMGDAPIDSEQRYVVFDGTERSVTVRDQRMDIETEAGYVGATTLDTE